MRISGVEVTTSEALLVLPRDKGDIPIKAVAVSIAEEFDEKCPMPVAPMLQTKDGNKPDLKDKDYKAALSRRSDMRWALMIIRSLEPSNIEWNEVNVDAPSTWLKWDDEMQAGGLSEVETNRIVGLVMQANSLDEAKIKAARANFLLGQGE
jgi:hypothetical protein